MEWDFKDKNLIKLYTTGKSPKHRGLPKNVVVNFVARVNEIDAAVDIYDLWKKPALKFEKLKGKKDYCSVRVTGKWRLEFKVDWEDEEHTRGFCWITALSNHYGD
ncbi:Toxin HigB-1 [Anaerohalosphaera lusitana]|uniref:Toxin HigB-1 n=1 Tax=Anaerohalosphaera lusitana TaxID=1936003 RepID=A0A1U9NKG5_9BACT|nr:type II toxin-antitoxin system RelE/ParE family toxin [Anaerohalosphaera lusitana]AQT68228.1 Toxin HigB-1 [Anaerohalosphaera lusitana]